MTYTENQVLALPLPKRPQIGGIKANFSLRCFFFGHSPNLQDVKYFITIPKSSPDPNSSTSILGCLAHCNYCLKSDVFVPFLEKGWHSNTKVFSVKSVLKKELYHEEFVINERECFPSQINSNTKTLVASIKFINAKGYSECYYPSDPEYIQVTREELSHIFKPRRLRFQSHNWKEMFDIETQTPFLFCMNSFKIKDVFTYSSTYNAPILEVTNRS